MPRYFFHIRYSDEFVPDPEGTDMASDREANLFALAAAREMAADDLKCGAAPRGGAIEVRDEAGVYVRTVPFRSAIDFEP
jgi:hypothetical protein